MAEQEKYHPDGDEMARAEDQLKPRERERSATREKEYWEGKRDSRDRDYATAVEQATPEIMKFLTKEPHVEASWIAAIIAKKYAEITGEVYVTVRSDKEGGSLGAENSSEQVEIRFWAGRPVVSAAIADVIYSDNKNLLATATGTMGMVREALIRLNDELHRTKGGLKDLEQNTPFGNKDEENTWVIRYDKK